MSDYGLEVRDAYGNVTFSSINAVGGCFAGIAIGNGVSATAFTYPDFAGRTAIAVPMFDPTIRPATVDYSLGYPRVTTPDPALGGPPDSHYAVFIQ